MKKVIGFLGAVTLLVGYSPSASALSLTDPGVVGYMEGQVDSNLTNEAIIANFLLAMGANDVELATQPPGVDCTGGVDQSPCEYHTGPVDYNGTVSGGFKVEGGVNNLTAGALASEYILAKYDGPNAGYVLFNTAAWGANTIPTNGSTIWAVQGSGLSHYTYFGTQSVPDGGTSLILLGAALGAIGMVRRRMNA